MHLTLSELYLLVNGILVILKIGDSTGIDEEAAKEWEHTLLQDSMDKELHELNKRLEQKEVCKNFFIFYFCIHNFSYKFKFIYAVGDETFWWI